MKKGDGIFVHFVLPGLVGQIYEGGLWSSVNGFLLFLLSNDIYGIFTLQKNGTGTGTGTKWKVQYHEEMLTLV